MKNTKGITLIALIITIIIMLILVAVSISVALNTGLFKSAGDATKGWKTAQDNEKNIGNGKITINGKEYNGFDDYIKQEVPSNWDGENTEIPEIKKNTETDKFEWYIYNAEQMKFLANFVNQTLTERDEQLILDKNTTKDEIAIAEDTTIYLMDDINLGATFDENGKLISGKEWIPIGLTAAQKLKGTFEGNNHYICGVYVNRDEKFNGIFGNCNTINNLTIKNSYIEGGSCTGGIAGAVRAGIVENCHNDNTTVVLKEGDYSSVGGLFGQSQANKISNCTNKGKIDIYGVRINTAQSGAGGIVGAAIGTEEITECINYGELETTKNTGMYVGGICGGMGSTDQTRFFKCKNFGAITGYAMVGGIVGILSPKSIVEECGNFEKIECLESYAGGISGQNTQKNGEATSQILKCYNSGAISGPKGLGGIVGWFCGETKQGSVEKCYSKGSIDTSAEESGAIIGKQTKYDGDAVLNNLYYLNTVGLFAINNQEQYNTETIKAVGDDLKTYEEFIEWINNK